MDNTKQDFENRKAEIENYFKFLLLFDKDETKLQFENGNSIVLEKIEPQFQTILIANAFLILYNLIESTIRNSIIEIYSIILNEQICYERLSENLQKIWIKQSIDKLKEGNFRPDTLRDNIYNFAQDILNKNVIELSKENMDFSGNLDAKQIRKLATKFGFNSPSNGRNLEEIRNKRNRLAHGEQTFYDVGKDFSVNDLNMMKMEVIIFLSEVIENIENYINEQKYLKN